MQSIPNNPILEYRPNALKMVRTIYGMDEEFMNQSIDIFETWIQQQPYFNKKDYSRDYLERLIIGCKGSVERAKKRLEKMSYVRTVASMFFEPIKAKNLATELDQCVDAILPKQTKDFCRVYLARYNRCESFTHEMATSFLKRLVIGTEYWLANDYAKGTVGVLDGRDFDVAEFVKAITNPENLRYGLMIIEAFIARIQTIHFLIPKMKFFEIIMIAARQVFSKKIQERWRFHETLESLYKYFPDKDILPVEYGGEEKSLLELNRQWIEVLSTDEYIEFRKEMNKGTIDTTIKSASEFYQHFSMDLGISGTFRKLNVD